MSDEFDRFAFGDRVVYVGPDELPSPYAAPAEWQGPFEFRHVSVGGALTLETRFNGRRRLASDHPANAAEHWREVSR